MSEDEIDKIIKEMVVTTQYEQTRAAEYEKLSYLEKLARKKGFANTLEYRNWLAQQKGFANTLEYQNWLAQQKGFANNVKYKNWQAQQKGFVNYAEYNQDLRFKRGKGTGLLMAENKNSSKYLGEYIAERLLPKIFQEPRMMLHGNRGYDAICKNGHKIDVKSSLLGKTNFWTFNIRYNKTADFFLCIGFLGSRDDLIVEHIWQFSGNEILRKCPVNELKNLVIHDTKYSLSRVAKHELTDKVDDANNICILFKRGDLK